MLSEDDMSLYIRSRPYGRYFKGIIEVSALNKSILPHYKDFFVMLLNKPNESVGHWVLIMRVKYGWVCFDSYGLPLDERIIQYFKNYDHLYRVDNDKCQIPFCSWNMNVEDLQSMDGKDSNQCGSWILYMLDHIFKFSKKDNGEEARSPGTAPISNFRVALNTLSPDGGASNQAKLLTHFT